MKKTVLITGGVRGIGLAIAKAFQEKDCRVIVTYSKDEENALIAKEAGLEVYRADVSKEADVLALFSKLQQCRRVAYQANSRRFACGIRARVCGEYGRRVFMRS